MTGPVSTAGRPLVLVAQTADIEEGATKLVKAGKTPLALIKRNGVIHCVSAICTHARVFLAPGKLNAEGLLECPSHGAKFSPVDGAVCAAPAVEPLKVYEVTTFEGGLYVDPGEEEAAAPANASTAPGARPSAAQWGKWK